MARTTPHVERDTLTVGPPGAEQAIEVGTPAWFRWLETATAFTFASPEGTFTARRERSSSGRGGWYWRAYQHRGGVRRRAYLGKAEELMLAQLHAVAASLASADAPSYIPARRMAEAAAPVDMAQAPAALPTGTATFLFTDIEGSSQLWEQHAQVMRLALARHDTLLRQAIGAHGGVVFKTVGDSVYAAFARAPDALAAALTAQRALQQEAWDLPTPLRVRMALHTGVAEPRERDYVGPPLNRLARLLTLGHGGQILLSRATHDLVADDLPPETSLRALGNYQLKDLTRPEPIFQCVSADLMADFPPLRTTEPAAGGERTPGIPLLATKLYVPRARPTLLARPRLLARLDASLAGGRCTLLSAPAGAGKTSLLASWLASVGRPVTWLSLDEHDQDAHQVLRYLIAALQTVAPACGRTALAWLDAPSPPPPEVVLTALVNDLAALPEPCLLVLDDYHTVEADVVMLGYMALARLQHARGDDASASATLISFADLARKRGFAPQLLARATAIDAQFRLAQGDLSAAERWTETSGLGADDALPYPREREHLTFARVLIAQRQSEAALRLLDRLLQDAEAKARMHSVIEILILQALARDAQGEQDAGLVALARALALAEPEGYVRTFVDEGLPMAALLAQSAALRLAQEPRRAQDDPISVYVERLLSVFPVEQRAARVSAAGASPVLRSALERSNALVEPLSKRELEVLSLMAQGLTNSEIAQQIVISAQTVKVHTRNIYGKLGVNSRRQAVTKARALGLLA